MKISLVVPVFNEQDTIPIFYNEIRNYAALKPYEVEIVFVNDGSKDRLGYGCTKADGQRMKASVIGTDS